MNSDHFEELCRSLQRRGYYVQLSRHAVTWRCDLPCGVDLLPAGKPRPFGVGRTALEAIEIAAAQIVPQSPKTKATSVAAGLPRGDR